MLHKPESSRTILFKYAFVALLAVGFTGWVAVVTNLHSQTLPSTKEKIFAKEEYFIIGRVSDKHSGKSLAGTHVSLKGTDIGTLTDENGEYSLSFEKAPDPWQLVFSTIGYSTKEVNVKGINWINVEMQKDAFLLNEVVAVGYAKDSGSIKNLPSSLPALRNNVKSLPPGVVVEQMPEFPGGKDAMYQYLLKNLRYPKAVRDEKAQGTVYVSLEVKEDGNIGEIEVVQGANAALDAETVRLVREMPRWKPALQRTGVQQIPVTVRYVLPIQFRLEGY